MDVSEERKSGDGDGGGGHSSSSRTPRSADSGGTKRPLDPLADDNDPLQTVRSIRRRLVLGAPGDDDSGDVGGDADSASGRGGQEGAGEANGKGPAARVEINNADLAELLRSTKPKGDPRNWARIFYRAQNSRRGTHAGGGR